MSASKPLRATVALLAALLLAGSALAQQANSREQEQVRRLRAQLLQVQQQQAADAAALQRATADLAAAKASADLAQAELRRLRGQVSAQTQTAAQARTAADTLQAERLAQQTRADGLQTELDASRAVADTLRADLRAQQQALAQGQAALADLNGRHSVQAQGLMRCVANNRALHALGLELLQRYADKDLREVLAQNEPFLQTRRVALENLLQGYQDKLDQQALAPSAPGAGEGQRAP